MTRAILWKETREQLAVLIALFVMGAGLVVGVAVLNPPNEVSRGGIEFREVAEAPRGILLAIVLVAGTVIGATLFAGEEELGSAKYLYTLPARLGRLFVAKVTAGLVLAGGVVLGLIAVGWGAGLYGGKETVLWTLGLGLAGLSAYCAGVAGSTIARSTLVACGLAVVFGQVWAVIGLLPGLVVQEIAVWAFKLDVKNPDVAMLPGLAMPLFVIPAALFQGFLQFTAPDRRRKIAIYGPGPISEVKRVARSASIPHFRLGFRQLLWLTRRQLFKPALVLGGFALAIGLILLHPDSAPALVWPVACLVFGSLAGVIAFADEQTHGVNHYWSERQLPAGRLWLAKACGAAALTFGLAILLLLPRFVGLAINEHRAESVGNLFHSGILPALHWSFLYYLLLGPVYGLAFGLACGMLFPKPVVAAATAMLLAGTTAVLWIPSLLSGGLHYWQILLPPFVVALTSRRLARAWANERVGTRRGIRMLVVGSVAALAFLALGIGYRAVEVREAPEGDDDIAFSKTIPTYDEKQAGRDLRAAAARFAENYRKVQNEFPERTWGKVGRNGFASPDAQPRQHYVEQLRAVAEFGWPEDRPDLDRWLDRLCSGDWIEKAVAMRGRPPGVFEDPNEMTFAYAFKQSEDARNLSTALIARGLQQQARGDDAAFVALADATLAATRTGRNKTTELGFLFASNWVWPVNPGLNVWLANLDGKPELLREMLAALREHEANSIYNPTELLLAEQIVIRNSYKAPQLWAHLLDEFEQHSSYRHLDEKVGRAEADWLAFAWTVPWEKERLRRLIGRGNGTTPNVTPIRRAVYEVEKIFDAKTPPPGSLADDRGLGDGLPGYSYPELMASLRRGGRLGAAELVTTAKVRMAIVKVALRLYQYETGTLPETLDALVPKYLPAVPLDPYDGQPIRYRVSLGETIYGKVIEPTDPPGREGIHHLNRAEFMAVASVAGGGVFWPTSNDPRLPPGRDLDRRLEPEEFDALAAVAGGVVQWPSAYDDPGFGGPGGPASRFPGGIDGPSNSRWPGDNVEWTKDEFQAMAAVAGGGAFWPFPTDRVLAPPGKDEATDLSEAQFDAVAAVAGAAVQWPLEPVWKDAPAATRVRIPVERSALREEKWVPKGQAILWCIGPDLSDDHGLFFSDGIRSTGDLVELVPLPPKPRAKENRR